MHANFESNSRINIGLGETKLLMRPDKSLLRAFWDWFVLFSGISTASNLSRTRPDPVLRRGLFLFRPGRKRIP
jgi:hypothetical protein